MILAHEEIELDHLDRVARVAAARHDVAPLAVQEEEAQVEQAVRDEQPHHGEVPVPGAAEPRAEREPAGDRVSFPRIERESSRRDARTRDTR